MALREIRVEGYRSVRKMHLPLERINVLTGPNGCGKSNLYNSLLLMAAAAQGRFARAMAAEGGMESVFWAGPERVRMTRKKPLKRVVLGIESELYGYEMQAGLRSYMPWDPIKKEGSMFFDNPEVKREEIWPAGTKGRTLMLERKGPTAWLRNAEGVRVSYPFELMNSESVLSQVIDAHLYPEISEVRNEALRWRFYHQFRTDTESPLRQPQTGVATPVLARDGADLAAAVQTIREIGDGEKLDEAIGEGLRGARVRVVKEGGAMKMMLETPGLLRLLSALELSDGQLRFLCLCAALLSPRPPSLLGLNEPETSLHPELIEPLARLIVEASRATQLWITTHSRELAERIEAHSGIPQIALELSDGETVRSEDLPAAEDLSVER